MLREIIKGNHKSWDEYLPDIEFSYNRVVHKTTNAYPFEVVYGFNPNTPLDLLLLPNPQEFVHKEGLSKPTLLRNYMRRLNSKYNNKMKSMQNTTIKGREKFFLRK